MNIYLVGFMGTGKSSVGRLLAARKKWDFIDLDEDIEAKEKRRIVDIFAEEGEPYFRRLEKKALKRVSSFDKHVVACGGGIVLDADNIKLMKKTGTLVCLCADCRTILKRVSSGCLRPILNVRDPAKKIAELLKARAPYYVKADKSIDTSKLTVAQVADKIIRASRK